MKKYNVCVIGGGASGMAAAIEIKKENKNISLIILEKKDILGKKLSATGNGRCNISNTNCPTFGDTAKFFRSIGVEIKTDEEGKAYPVSLQAKDVTEAFSDMLKAYGVEIKTNAAVSEIEKTKDGFFIKAENDIYNSEKVILATGGKAAPFFGTSGDGYTLARKLGHKVNKTSPALVALECESDTVKVHKGVRAKADVTLYRHGFSVETQSGELQFTSDGLSGICIFNLSNYVRLNENTAFEDYEISVDFLPLYKPIEIYHILSQRRTIPNMETENIMRSIVNMDVGRDILNKWSKEKPYVKDIDDKELEDIVMAFKDVRYKVTGAKGWKEAQCTAGGVSWDDFNIHTMESNICPGLYFTGEIIDYVGPCGGYNLENAWNTARKAGKAICTEYMR